MKAILIVLILAIAYAQSPELEACIKEKCPDQYQKCHDDGVCEEKVKKCAEKCGEVYDFGCWSGCVGLFGKATNVCICAVNEKCIPKQSLLARLEFAMLSLANQENLSSQ